MKVWTNTIEFNDKIIFCQIFTGTAYDDIDKSGGHVMVNKPLLEFGIPTEPIFTKSGEQVYMASGDKERDILEVKKWLLEDLFRGNWKSGNKFKAATK